jgi:hypothetical protein
LRGTLRRLRAAIEIGQVGLLSRAQRLEIDPRIDEHEPGVLTLLEPGQFLLTALLELLRTQLEERQRGQEHDREQDEDVDADRQHDALAS